MCIAAMEGRRKRRDQEACNLRYKYSTEWPVNEEVTMQIHPRISRSHYSLHLPMRVNLFGPSR